MDNYKKPEAVSPSSFTADLFGFKEPPPSSSTGIFASIFPPQSTVLSKKPPTSEVRGSWQKQHSGNPVWNPKQVSDAASYDMPNNNRDSMFQVETVEPCHLSSSLYYGGQDNYSEPPTAQTAGSYPIWKKDYGGEADPNGNGASRGNWWQGSLYY